MKMTNPQNLEVNSSNTLQPKKECCKDCKNGKKGKCHEKIMQQLEKIDLGTLINKNEKEN